MSTAGICAQAICFFWLVQKISACAEGKRGGQEPLWVNYC